MGLEIAGEEARRLAEQLAARRGVSIEQVVEDALREELTRVGPVSDPVIDKWRLIAEGIRDRWPKGMTAVNATDFLYDEDSGLPR